MDKIFNCIDGYIRDLEKDVLEIVANQKSSMIEKNILLEPLSEQKKVLLLTLDALNGIKNKNYTGGCTMYKTAQVPSPLVNKDEKL